MKTGLCLGIWLWLLTFLGTGLPAWVGAAEPTYIAYTGKAAGTGGEFLYAEHHVLKYEGDRLRQRVVLYQCADGSAFARKTANYVQPLAPDFLFEDSSNGEREGVRSEGGSRTVFFRANTDAREKSAPLEAGTPWVIDAGFDEFIRDNWRSLMEDRTMPLHFLVPSRLSGVNFQVEHVGRGKQERTAEVFRLKIAGIVGWVAPSIDVTYSAADHVLVRYEGLSELRDRKGDNLRTTIAFRAEDRRPADAAAFAAALQSAIAPCRG